MLGNVLVGVLIGAGLTLAAVLLWQDVQNHKKELMRMEKLRGSNLYYDLYPIVARCRKRRLEEVRVEEDLVTFRMVSPAGREVHYQPEQRGFRPLSPARARALIQVLGEDIPELRDRSKYTCRRYRIRQPNGAHLYGYVYTIRTKYKDSLNRTRLYLKQAV